MAALLVISLAACGNSKKEDTTVKQTDSSQVADTTAQETTAQTQTSEAKSTLVGSWEYKNGGYTYHFNEDGTGTYDTGAKPMEFTYTATDKELSITYTGNTEPLVLKYEIDGDKLNVIDSLGNDTIYYKK